MRLKTKSLARLLPLFAAPAIAALSPILALPLVVSTYGADGWADVIVGQAVGTALAVVVELGWGLTGPVRVARTQDSQLFRLYADSLWQRWIVGAAVLPIAAIIAGALAHQHALAAAVSAAAGASTGLSAAWFYIGRGDGARFLLLDAMPRTVSTLAGALALYLGAPLVILPILQLIAALAIPFTPFRMLSKDTGARSSSIKTQIGKLRMEQGWPFLVRAASSAYVALPLPLIAILGTTSDTVAITSVDRLEKFALAGLLPLTQILQRWASMPVGHLLHRRLLSSLYVHAGVGCLSGIIFFFLAPDVMSILFRDTVVPDSAILAAYSIALGSVLISRSLGTHTLTILGHLRSLALALLAVAVISVITLVLGFHEFGPRGAAGAVAVTELIVVLLLGLLAWKALRKSSHKIGKATS